MGYKVDGDQIITSTGFEVGDLEEFYMHSLIMMKWFSGRYLSLKAILC